MLLLVLMFLGKSAAAGVMVESSRVVFSASDRERSLMLSNTNDYPVIVQTWIDDGSPEGTPETAVNAPVMPLPGIFRLEPGEKKFLRLLATGMDLPKDRESLFWLNIYEIPPSDARLPPGTSAIKVAVRLQLKMFWRPQNLAMGIDEAADALQFSLNRQPGSVRVKAINPTPYYVSFNAAGVMGKESTCPVDFGMISPKGEKEAVLNPGCEQSAMKLHYMLINDDGNLVEAVKKLK